MRRATDVHRLARILPERDCLRNGDPFDDADAVNDDAPPF